MFEDMKEFLTEECMLKLEKPLLVGVSGGPDSLCLAHMLSSLGFSLVIAHLNHGIRKEARSDSETVRKFSVKLNKPFRLGQEDVKAYSDANSISIEEAARILRYRFLFQEAKLANAQAVVVGHNADDQVESIVMHLLRGAGISGLKGMQPHILLSEWSTEISLVRPLLNTWRQEILTYCSYHDLEPVFDRSNQDTTYFRNRIRQKLIPELESYNPQFRKVIWRMSQTLAADQVVLAAATEDAWKICAPELGEGFVSFSAPNFLTQSLGLQRGIVRKAFTYLRPGLRDIDFGAVERALEFVSQPTKTKQQDLIAGLRIQIEGKRVFLAAWEADLPSSDWPIIPEESLLFDVPAILEFGDKWRLVADYAADVELAKQEAYANTDPFIAWLSADKFEFPLSVRRRQPGDRFQPLGMDGHSIKLAKYFINVKIPRRARGAWPVIFFKDEILWVPGFRIGHDFRLTDSTQQVVKLSLEKIKKD
ncbi:MAG: tRNA lysidine(34) synthetase TilS [Chloroflexi bacterium]|nr:tRNA lysidine(34) synthetase TilS [Chloroflexota bacterium]